jgi:hypothetical protein
MPLESELMTTGGDESFRTLLVAARREGDERAVKRFWQAGRRWQLLLQIGNVSGIPYPAGYDFDLPAWRLGELCDLWARGGLMYFWIERDRLAQRDFSNVWLPGASQL